MSISRLSIITAYFYLCHESDRFSLNLAYKHSANQEEVALYNKSVLLFSNLSLPIYSLYCQLYVHKKYPSWDFLVVQ